MGVSDILNSLLGGGKGGFGATGRGGFGILLKIPRGGSPRRGGVRGGRKGVCGELGGGAIFCFAGLKFQPRFSRGV